MILHIEKIVMLEITERIEVKIDEDGHYFRTTHCPLALSVLASIWFRYCHFLYFCIIFFAKIVDNTKNLCSFVFGNLHNLSSL